MSTSSGARSTTTQGPDVAESPARRLSAVGQAYVAAVGTAGAAVVAFSLLTLQQGDVPVQWALFGVLTIVCGGFTVPVPSVNARLSVSEIFAFTCVLLFGPEAAAVTLAIDALLLSLRWRYTPAQTFFNFGNLPLSIWCAGTLFFAASGLNPLFRSSAADGSVLLPLGAMTCAYFLLNSTLTAVAVALDSRQPPLAIWREHFMWLAPGYAAGASVALLLVVALRQVHFSAIALVPPLLFLSYLTLRSSLGRLEDAKRHVDKLNRLYLSTVETLATAIDAKDEVTHDHVRRVQSAAVGLARELGVTDGQILQALEAAAAARHRQDRGAGAHSEQAGTADPRRIRKDEAARADRRADSVVDRLSLSGCADRPPPSRELGRHGLP